MLQSSRQPFALTRSHRSGGVEGNDRLTASAGAALFLLLAAEGVTIVFIRPLLSAHVFIGMLLIPPVALKLASTGWRFLRFYAGNADYRAKGPPLLPLRMLAPLVVASTLMVLATGVALLVVGPGGGFVLGLHKASFVVWLVATGIHVLAYVWRVPSLAAADWRAGPRAAAVSGSFARRTLLAGALVAGVVLALVTVRYAHAWVNWAEIFRGHDG
ncbi:MAG TPA: hypothetical protein VFL60_03825 [Gaiellaceae bacterium]|nr:hypothetical protein [Gaiellaceae bacterium]